MERRVSNKSPTTLSRFNSRRIDMALKMKSSDTSTTPSNSEMNFIAAGTYLEGKIETKGSLRIDGKVKGTVKVADRLTVGSSGEVMGEIHAKTAIIGGKVEGDVHIEQKITLESTSTLNGNLWTGKLIIDEGAFFNGKSDMGGAKDLANNGKKGLFDKSKASSEVVSDESQKNLGT
ncbi:MAG: polymer-forming cytoskeletal protein [Calditrichaeota bacterium]|nr:MAG: polymer-forming cytoskeletal protein [Calditrichota bacterium]